VRKSLLIGLRVALAAALGGSVFVQVVMVPLIAIDFEEADSSVAYLQIPLAAILIAIIATAQVALVCVWRLATMVFRGTVFSSRAFRYVDVMIGAFGAAAVLTLALGVVLAPGDAVPPGMVLLVGGAAVVAATMGLIVLLLRTLLSQAIDRDVEAHEMRAELDEVI
jgi:hypothetical protein